MALGTIISGTRFKRFDQEVTGLAPTLCRKCGIAEDGIVHMLECYEMGGVPADVDSLVTFLVELAGRTVVLNPNVPLPLPTESARVLPEVEEASHIDRDVLWPEEGEEEEEDIAEDQNTQRDEEVSVLSIESEEDGDIPHSEK